jgi:hypothetical protein
MSQLPSLALIPADNAALIERDEWASNGIKSPAHWLNYHCGIDLGAARESAGR